MFDNRFAKLPRPSVGRWHMLLLLALALASITAVAANPDRAFALCSGHAAEYGDWVNADPNASGIARIELRDCQPVTTCSGGTCSTTHDAGWTMRVFGRCSPTNCDWGWTSGAFRRSSGQIPGYYNQGFAKRYVYAKMSQQATIAALAEGSEGAPCSVGEERFRHPRRPPGLSRRRDRSRESFAPGMGPHGAATQDARRHAEPPAATAAADIDRSQSSPPIRIRAHR